MTKRAYPDQLDWVWLASDKSGQVAAFVTAGSGPIPVQVLNSDLPDEDPEKAISQLLLRSEVTLLVSLPDPTSFVAMAERGFFVYDWSDIHRSKHKSINAYEQMAIPRNPIFAHQLPKQLAQLVNEVRLANVVFALQRPWIYAHTSNVCRLNGKTGDNPE